MPPKKACSSVEWNAGLRYRGRKTGIQSNQRVGLCGDRRPSKGGVDGGVKSSVVLSQMEDENFICGGCGVDGIAVGCRALENGHMR
jgi:hypothetical protein